jgi:hypothetical protein
MLSFKNGESGGGDLTFENTICEEAKECQEGSIRIVFRITKAWTTDQCTLKVSMAFR